MSNEDKVLEIQRQLRVVPPDPTEAWDAGFAAGLAQRDKDRDLLEWAWSIIANAGAGDWTKESPEWQKAAGNWRDRVHDLGAVRG